MGRTKQKWEWTAADKRAAEAFVKRLGLDMRWPSDRRSVYAILCEMSRMEAYDAHPQEAT
ncbi:MAG: hypothetical protein ACYDDA_12370 [Acidiferrobacteraceae bacterium]